MKTNITNISTIYTWSPVEDKLVILSDVEILVEDSTIIQISKTVGGAEEEIDADGALITPGFVDSHTHPIFSGNRANEFGMRVSGKSYEEIASMGGGIISSINEVRNASEKQLLEECLERINFFLIHGTTTIEAKSGYGLTIEDELKSLKVIKRLNESSPLDIIPTFMGAHAFPPEFKNDHQGYVQLICEEMIPVVAEENLAEFCDVFCENGYFTLDDSRKILETAKEYGLTPRLHADEFVDSGAAGLSAEVGAISADHLMAVSNEGIQKMAEGGVIATLLPGTTLFLGKNKYAPGRKIIDSGCDVALATDYNPGSCTIQSMPQIISLANLHCGLSIDEAFKGATWNGAKAINRGKKLGAIVEGFQADMLFWELGTIEEIPYWMGSDRILNVMKKGILLE
jgi:imidazolonepropionase